MITVFLLVFAAALGVSFGEPKSPAPAPAPSQPNEPVSYIDIPEI